MLFCIPLHEQYLYSVTPYLRQAEAKQLSFQQMHNICGILDHNQFSDKAEDKAEEDKAEGHFPHLVSPRFPEKENLLPYGFLRTSS